MFSGLIAHLARISAIDGDAARGMRLVVEAPEAIAEGVAAGDSIAIDGVCLTVAALDARTLSFDVVPETVNRATLLAARAGDPVNLELSLRLGDRLGGHFVYGHVDGTARILAKDPEGQGRRLTLERPPALTAYIVEKGFVAVDGISLTVASVLGARFTIAQIPETLKRTTLGTKGPGARVNLEIDPVARYAIAAVNEYTRSSASSDGLAWAYEI
jgi:riboflavin synthase